MKIDDPQTILQFPDIMEIYKRYKSQGLNVLAFPTEQGWFEPDDDETCRAKAKEFYGFGDYPQAVVFDKVGS
jgi:glutathione peroxidase